MTLLDMQEMIKPPVTRQTNLHNAIFCPSNLHAKDEEPASMQNYTAYSLRELLNEALSSSP